MASDKSPTLWDAKETSIWDIARGSPGTGVLLPLVLSERVNKGRLRLEKTVSHGLFGT